MMVFFVHIITLLVSLTLCVCNMCDLNRVRITCWNARVYLASIPYNEQLTSECDILAISQANLPSQNIIVEAGGKVVLLFSGIRGCPESLLFPLSY